MKLLKKIKTFFGEKLNFFFHNDKCGWRSQNNGKGLREVSLSYRFGRNAKYLAAGFVIGSNGDETFSVHLGIPFLFNIYLNIDTPSYKWLPDTDRRTEISICNMGIFLYFWKDDFGYSKKWGGWNNVFTWEWLLCGSNRNEQVKNDDGTLAAGKYTIIHDLPPFIGHPDGLKDVRFSIVMTHWVTLYPNRWYMKWYRHPFTRIEVSTPDVIVKVPGKGDNPFDLDDEFYGPIDYGSNTRTIQDAINDYCKGITRYMQR